MVKQKPGDTIWKGILSVASVLFLTTLVIKDLQNDARQSSDNPLFISEEQKKSNVVDAPAHIYPESDTTSEPPPRTLQSSGGQDIISKKIGEYIGELASLGYPSQEHGVWMQTRDTILAEHQGKVALPAASVTKVATTLAALIYLGPDHRFITRFSYDGQIVDGVLNGNLIVKGSGDPFFVWEDAIKVGNLLSEAGISYIAGDLLIDGNFYMNWKSDPLVSGNFLRKALNHKQWTSEVWNQYKMMPSDINEPEVTVRGTVQVTSTSSVESRTPLVEHSSLPLTELLKRMNNYSNNPMAEMIASAVGGAKKVEEIAINATDISESEISLVNGSGLGDKNLISPHAMCSILLTLQKELEQYDLSIADVMTVIKLDESILDSRDLPENSILKSGSLKNVSALAGVLSTQKKLGRQS